MKKHICFTIAVIMVLSVFGLYDVPVKVQAAEPFVVVVDPGHGGYDPGACVEDNGVEYREKVFNLKIANAIRDELSQYEGVKVYLTREENETTYMTLHARVDFAKEKGADVLVSVHNNSAGATASGCMAMSPNGKYNKERANESIDLGTRILNKLEKLGLKNMGHQFRSYEKERGITYPNGENSDYYGIIRQSMIEDITGVLIEYQFLTNEGDLNRLKNDDNLKAYGKATATAIAEKYGLKKGPDTETVEHIVPQTERVYVNVSGTTFTYGDGPITLSAGGGSGSGSYSYSAGSLDVLEVVGNKAYIVGSGSCSVYATKNASGNYGPESTYGKGTKSITINPKSVSLSATTTTYSDMVGVIVTLKGYVEGDLPSGPIQVFSGGKLLKKRTFDGNEEIRTEIKQSDVVDNKITVKYVPSTYDNYKEASVNLDVKIKTTPTAAPTATPTPAPTPVATPVATPTAGEEPTPTPEAEPTPTAEEPTALPSSSPDSTEEPTPENSAEPSPENTPETGRENKKQQEKNSHDKIILAGIIVCVVAIAALLIIIWVNRKNEE